MICQILYSNLHFLEVNNLFHLACIKLKLELACWQPWNLPVLYITFQPVRITTFRSASNRIIKFSLKYSTLHVKSLYNFSHCTSVLHSLISWIRTTKLCVINIWYSVKIGMQVCSFKWCLVAMMMTAQPIQDLRTGLLCSSRVFNM